VNQGAARRTRLFLITAALIGMTAALAALSLLQALAFRAVILPVLALTALVIVVVASVSYQDPDFPADDAGLWIAGFTWLYGALPALAYVGFGYQFSPFSASRLYHGDATAWHVGRVVLYYAIVLGGFAAAYLLLRRGARPLDRNIESPPNSQIVAIFGLAVAAVTVLALIRSFYGLHADSYQGSYRVIQQLPLGARQAWAVATSVQMVLVLALLVLLFSRWRRWWPVIILWMAYQLVTTFVLLGARTSLMIVLSASLVLFHRSVRRLSGGVTLGLALAALLLFTTLGVLRMVSGVQEGGGVVAVAPGEFDVVFTNAIDLMLRREGGTLGSIPLSVAFYDFIGFIPSQLLPVEKLDPPGWLLKEFYPEAAERGAGLMFGTVAQVVIGFGAAEAAVRGVVLGALFGIAFRAYRRHAPRFWVTVGYVWALVLCYLPLRGTTLILVGIGVQRAVPAVLLILAVAWLLKQALQPPVRSRPEPSPAAR
jgi:hypothetical protein